MEKEIKEKNFVLPLLFFTFGVVVLLNVGGWLFYLGAEAFLEKDLGERLSSLAEIIGRFYQEDKNAFELLTSCLINEGDIRGIIVWEGENEEVLGNIQADLVETLDEEEIKRAWEGEKVYTPYYRINSIAIKRGYAPIRENEAILGIVVVEGKATILNPLWEIKRSLILVSLSLSFLLFLSLSIFYFFYTRYFKMLQKMRFQERVALLGKTISSLLHALGNPLGIMQSALEALRETKDEEKRSKYLSYLEEEIKRIREISQKYLKGEKEIVDLKEITEEILIPFLPSLKRERITIEKFYEEGDFRIYGEKERIKNALVNLITNAREALPNGGKISIQITKRKDVIIWRIKDTGIGMDRKTLKRLFQPLTSTKDKGRGWGLVEVKDLMESLGGKIRVRSKKGKGSEFSLYFPSQF
ncbi:HAMP domain-containing histidine kinase [Candidatus Calescamantes bacterium]|nr:HAMP domain-containing histidine kinase [Candidatus Calescamantes bacterium]